MMFTCDVNAIYNTLDASAWERDSNIFLKGRNDAEQTCGS